MSSMHSGSDSSSSGSMMSMSMVFTTDHSTALYSSAWTPSSTGAYAGTCIFLIFLAVVSRLFFAWRRTIELNWSDRASQRKYVRLMGRDGVVERQDGLGEKADGAVLTTRGVDERIRIVQADRTGPHVLPWRFGVDVPRACLFTVHAGIGYLLLVSSYPGCCGATVADLEPGCWLS